MKFFVSVSVLSTVASVAFAGYMCQDDCMNVSNDMNYEYQPMQEAEAAPVKPISGRRRRISRRFRAYCSAIEECKTGCLEQKDKAVCKTYRKQMRVARRKSRTPEQKAASKARFNAYCAAIDECKTGCLDNGDKSVCKTYRKSFRKQNRKARRVAFRSKFKAFCAQIEECNSGCLVNKDRSVCRTFRKQFRQQNKKN
ncbi:hypothetical protein AYI70_g1482 [Smittium culicis]|uniref:Uncharacterized protein n=1 Tax=Smittium culicis TaxID=133412 RepID=A0A1R1YCS0_9FUNG|nr:hypothetical protein AYI70_g1482 [Smittium culicis]